MRRRWWLLAVCLVAVLAPDALAGESAALILDPNDEAGGAAVVETLAAMRIRTRDVHAKLADDKLSLTRFGMLIVGPRATRDSSVTNWMRRNADDLRTFVAEGGVVVVFDQEPDFWDIEPWLPVGCFLLRGRTPPGRTVRHEAGHPLFNRPHVVDPAGASGKALAALPSGSAFRHVRGFHVLAEGSGGPWCVVTGCGTGRVLVLAWSPKAATPGALPGANASRPFLENVLTYAVDAANGKAPALPTETRVDDWSGQARLDAALFTPESEKDLDRRVDAAVDRGVEYLQGQQKPDGSWGPFEASNGTYRSGITGISLLALLASGVSKHEASIRRGFDWLLANPPEMTYEISLAMMALEAKASPLRERFEIRDLPPERRREFEFRRDLTERERRFMADCRDRLLQRWVQGGTWCYRPGLGNGDISNGQYALLGLRAASRCGLEVDEDVWRKALDYYLAFQEATGPKVVFPDFRRFESDRTPKFYAERAEARGWQYLHGRPGQVLGTHVCIGVASTIICYEELKRRGGRRLGRTLTKVRKAVRDGCAWLHGNWSVDHIPGGDKYYYYYYIFSLERVGVLTQRRFIGDHDWYREGAEYLLAKQEGDGSWHSRSGEWGTPLANTAFALLFFKRSTPPPVVTLGN